MTVLWAIIGFLWLLIIVFSAVDLFQHHLGAGRTAAWLLLIIIFPILGTILYWVLARPSKEELALAASAEEEARHGHEPPHVQHFGP